MCLGVPGRVVQVEGLVATVDFWGVRREVRLDVVDEPVAPGDYVLNHVGYAIRRIPEGEIAEGAVKPIAPKDIIESGKPTKLIPVTLKDPDDI